MDKVRIWAIKMDLKSARAGLIKVKKIDSELKVILVKELDEVLNKL